MTKPTQAILTLIAIVACASAFAAGNLEQWEMTSKTIGAAGSMPEQKMIVCRKKDEAAKPPAPANCKYSGTGSATSHGAFIMECSGEHPYTIKGEGRQTATTMEGTMDIIMSGTEVNQAYSGKLIGSCEVEGVKMGDSAGAPGSGGPQLFDRRSMMQPDGSPPPFARERTQAQAAESPPPPTSTPPADDDKPKSAAEKAKKALKKLLPF